MFSYYGAKTKLVHLYPPPKHGRIIEPFAGSARYALKHWENEVELYDMSEYVVKVWRYLINVKERDILKLPYVESKVSLDSIEQLTEAERYLIGFSLCRGKAKPRKVGHGQNSWNRDKIRIADNLYKIRHWKIFKDSYENIPNKTATWFIDPPYQSVNSNPKNTDRYEHHNVDYDKLAEFCKTRRGMVIACEGDGASYLPFQLLTTVNANTNNKFTKKNNEYVFIQNSFENE